MVFTVTIIMKCTGCSIRYRTRHFFNNSNTNKDIATKFEQEHVRCVRNEEECVCSYCNILISGKIIKEMPGWVASATHCISTVKPIKCINISNLFYWRNTLQVSDGLSVHHQEFKTVHTATGICQTDTAVCLLAKTFSLASRQQYLFDICLLLYVQS